MGLSVSKRRLLGSLLAAIVVILSGRVAAHSASSQAIAKESKSLTTQAQPASDSPHEYVLQPGDELNIRVYEIPQLNDLTKIRPDGKISLLLLNDIQAAGKTVPELEHFIAAGYSKYYRNPRVSVGVQSFTNMVVFVGGEVKAPGLLRLNQKLTATSALFQAGGPLKSADLSSVVVLRNKGGRPRALTVNIRQVVKGSAKEIRLHPYDVVYVPKTRIAKIDQWVDMHMREIMPIPINGGFTYLLNPKGLF